MIYSTVREVARRAHVKEAAVYYLVRKGFVGSARLGTRLVFTEQQAAFVVAFIHEQRGDQ